MLKLHSLEINGFKSFLDPVEVKFAAGITAIVGPNGCGKSNLSDAINWVLGEQSAKTLRGTKMEDIIFSGSAKRKPLGMAEVSLIMATDPGFPHSVDSRIKIGRQVFRSGESRYRLNDKVVRLKEVKDILMDTGLGIRAYSVIEQGKIGMILSGKPQERRKLLEEAAGITRYKARKRVAEVKLEESLANLLRLDDIISEVDRTLRSLKRQASAARRYQAKETEYRDLLRQVLLGRWALMKQHLDALNDSLAQRTDQEAEAIANLDRDEAGLAAGREELDRLAVVLGERHQALSGLAATIEGRQEFIKGSRQRSKEMDERLKRGRVEAEERQRQTNEFMESLGNLGDRALEVLQERDEAARLVAEDDEKIAAAQRAVKESETRLEGLRQELLASADRVNQARAALQRETAEIERATYRLRFLDGERDRLDRQVAEATAVQVRIEEQLAKDGARLEEETARHGKLKGDLDAVLRREAELAEERQQLESRLSNLRQRRKILVELSREHEERRRALVEGLQQIDLPDPTFLADQVRPAEGWEAGIDHYLGGLADAVVLDGEQSALEVARALSESQTSATLIRPLSGDDALAEVEDEALAYSLAEALDLDPELAHSLPPAYLVEDAEDAQRLAAQHPGIAFISRQNIWAVGGSLRVRSSQAAPGVLARESELESIKQEIPQLEQRLEQVRQTLASLVAERTRLASEMHRVEESSSVLRRELAVAQARLQDAKARSEKIGGEHSAVAQEQAELQATLQTKEAQRLELQSTLEATDKAHQDLNQAFDRGQLEVDAAKDQRELLRTEGAGRRGRLQLLEERLQSHDHEVLRVRRQITYTEEQLRIWADEGGGLERRLEELIASMDAAEEELQQALVQRVKAEEAVLEQQNLLDERRLAIRVLEEKVRGLRGQREELRTSVESLRVDQARAKQDAEHLAASYTEAFRRYLPGTKPETPESEKSAEGSPAEAAEALAEGAPSTDLAAKAHEGAASETNPEADPEADQEADPADSETEAEPEILEEEDLELPNLSTTELTQLEAELARCKAILERLGPVNVLAATEYEEAEERGTFLRKQRKDVATSVESLRTTIQEINDASSERFKATFEAVNRVFGETFQRLFRGGDAEMRLFDEDDVLETGIEIMARPPGKRPQNIMLLSGGEKALTAIALLFALFQSKPSPFCILDEVDAPLDDTNVLRFVEALKEMAKDTQFLVVTHNKLTMEVAASLYGVTMEEKGVSKLVQAEMEDLHPVPVASSEVSGLQSAQP